MSGEVFLIPAIVGVGAVVAVGFASRTAIAGTTLALEGVSALGEHMNEVAARAEEAHREACAWGAAASGVLDRNARLAVLAEACAGIALAGRLPGQLDPHGRTAEELLRWCGETDESLREVDAQLSALTAAAAAETVFDDLLHALGGSGRAGSAAELAALLAALPAAPDGWRDARAAQELAETLDRVLGRLAARVSAQDLLAIREAARRIGAASGPAEAQSRVVDVRHRVQQANQAAAGRRVRAVEAARLLHALQRDAPAEHEDVRARLTEVVAGRADLDPALREQARAACAAVVAAADRAHVKEKLLVALGDLGYQVEDESGHPLRLAKEDWDQHAVQLLLTEDGQVRSAVVRTADGSDADAAREQEWCDAVDQARTRLSADGVDTGVTRELPPGTRPAPRVRPTGAKPRRLPRARHRDRPE
ncbi:hypothetical protein Aph01nite_64410 [Acrocarpospora phusangensis]|uniref:Uncharacterized protein n=1 Tax=Acrocarpospora phusangensis TaxID=1070424 RepID=A0A919QHU1_9ACTN|nr:hypothetical protein [Acrocarpospora phusangensis]GIH28131.1 hypothetical protein Aph01nite_64410 [Acrocarpospora phusangensis]